VTAVRSASGQLISGERSQHVELVTIRVAHDHPADVALADVEEADVEEAGAERLQPGDLSGLVNGPKVQSPAPGGGADQPAPEGFGHGRQLPPGDPREADGTGGVLRRDGQRRGGA
jgi:hypothetical protein